MFARAAVTLGMILWAGVSQAGVYYISPGGSDTRGAGTAEQPWATLQHAAKTARDDGAVIVVGDGVYVGDQTVDRTFKNPCLIRAEHPYRARFRSPDGSNRALHVFSGANFTFEGLEFTGSGGGKGDYVIHVSLGETHHLTFQNCIIHDSYGNDLVKVNDACHDITFRGCLLYNAPDPGGELFDINVVTDVTVEDCILLSDLEGSGRKGPSQAQAFVVIKNSSTSAEHRDWTKRITLRRNIFCNWQGKADESPVLVGEDGKDFWEAQDVTIENNLFLFNNANPSMGAVSLKDHVRNITVRANTVLGTVTGRSAFGVHCSDERTGYAMENIYIYGNIFSDPGGQMPAVVTGRREFIQKDLLLWNNLYWNGGKPFGGGRNGLFGIPGDDGAAAVGNPGLAHPGKMVLPRWDAGGAKFLSGQTAIRGEFERLVEAYAVPPRGSPAIGSGDPKRMPPDDILGRKRGPKPDIGACQAVPAAAGPATKPAPKVNPPPGY